MSNLLNRAGALLTSEGGPTSTEYAVLLALLILVVMAAITGLGTTVSGVFTSSDAALPGGTTADPD